MGLMLAEPGFHTRCFVEWEEYPRSTLIAAQRAGYFAPAPIWDDVTTFDGRPFRGAIDTIIAGYPCQPFSHAGQRRGEDDPRHLWPHVARVVRECDPEWVFLENVSGHVTLGAETVLRELRDMGYTAAAGLFSAAETGAPHERLRWFCVAHRDTDADTGWVDSRRTGRSQIESQGQGEQRERFRAGPGGGGDELEHATSIGWREGRAEPEVRGGRDTASGAGSTVDDSARVGREIHAGSRGEGRGTSDSGRPVLDMADTSGAGLEGREWSGSSGERLRPSPSGSTAERGRPFIHPPGPADMGRWADALVTSPDLAPSASFGDLASFAGQVAAMAQAGLVAEAEIEPALRRMADGLALRSRALRLLGNGVHPLAAAYAWRSLAAAHGLGPVDLEADGTEGSGGTDEFSMMAAQWGGWAEEQMRATP